MIIFYLACVIIVVAYIYLDCRKPPNLPPGPFWWPIFGSSILISRIRKEYGMLTNCIEDLARKFKEDRLVSLKIGISRIVVCLSSESIKEMTLSEDMDGRPNGRFFEDRTFGAKRGVLLSDGELWSEQRKFLMRHLREFGYSPRGMAHLIQFEAEHLMLQFKCKINENGGKAFITIRDAFQTAVLNTIWMMLASKRYEPDDAELKHLQEILYDLFINVDMIGTVFSCFPLTVYVTPKSSGYTDYMEFHRKAHAFFGKEVEHHKRTFSMDNEPRDIIDVFLRAMNNPEKKANYTEQQLLSICLDIFLAGTETSAKTMGFAFLYLVRDSRVQQKAQKEIDEVVGRSRLPQLDDRPQMPYCEAIVLEAVRMFMSHTFAVPHCAVRDTKLCGYDIPKDTMVIGCYRGMMTSPKLGPNPEIFYPERFIKDGKVCVPEDFYPFGLGRHRCMGEMLAKGNLFVLITTLLQNFNFNVPDGHPLPDDRPIDGATPSIRQFTACITAR